MVPDGDGQRAQNKRQDGDVSRTLRVIDNTKSELLTHADPARAAILAAAGGEADFLSQQRVRKETQIKLILAEGRDGLIPFY